MRSTNVKLVNQWAKTIGFAENNVLHYCLQALQYNVLQAKENHILAVLQ